MCAMARGALVVFEGCDRVGKSTQCKKLIEALTSAGFKNKAMKFPDRTSVIGQYIDAYLTRKVDIPDKSVHLLFAANRWELESEIRQSLQAGVTLVIDRYSYSGVAYTAAKKVAPLWWCKAPDVGIPAPDVVFYLKLPATVAETRNVFGSERYEQVPFQQEVGKQFEKLRDNDWVELDASQEIGTLHSQILTRISKVIEQCAHQPIGKLWEVDASHSS